MGQRSDSAYSAALLISFILFTGITTNNPSTVEYGISEEGKLPNPIPEGNYLTDVNLAPMFQGGTGQFDGCKFGDYHLWGYFAHGSTDPLVQSVIRDDSVTYNGHSSARFEGAIPTNLQREINQGWITVHPGDHIYMKAYVKTGALPSSPLPNGEGALIGFDFYHGTYGRISECHPRTIQDEIWRVDGTGMPLLGEYMNGSAIRVPYNSDWTLSTLDVTIPATYYAGEAGAERFPTSVQIQGIMPWLGMSWHTEDNNDAYGWFADVELYVNPSDPFVEQVQTPTFSPIAGVYGSTQTVTISSTTPSATIYYTNNGSTPTSASNEYTEPLSVAETTTLKALATKTSYTDSSVGTALYTINNPVTPSAAAARAYMAMLRRR